MLSCVFKVFKAISAFSRVNLYILGIYYSVEMVIIENNRNTLEITC